MKTKLFYIPIFAAAILLLALMLSVPVRAMPLTQTSDPVGQILDILIKLIVGFASLAGVASLIAALINLGKVSGLVTDGAAAKWSAGLNLVAFGVLVYFGVFQPGLALEVLDDYAGRIAQVLIFILGFIIQITGSATAHKALKTAQVPLIGKSFS
jgi:hypothetical protein